MALLQVQSHLPQPFTSFCDTCRNGLMQVRLGQDTAGRQEKSYLYKNRPVEDLLSAARNRCRICKLYLDSRSARDLRRLLENRVVDRAEIDYNGTTLEISGEFNPSDWPPSSEFILNLVPIEDLEGPLPAPFLAPSTQSDSTWHFITRCILECLTSHSKCSKPCALAVSPTRLIDVGYHTLSKIHIVETKEILQAEKLPPYVTLSHSWRTGNPTTLLLSNLQQLQDRIREDLLSQTFRDAIAVTRKLGFRYLWIDSLCIIQDCVQDWQREAALMGDIYRGGICNIAATAAGYRNQGLFTARDTLAVSPFSLPLCTKNGTKPYLCFQGDRWFRDVATAALNRRGWVLQERLLSSRTIHFSSQIFWECRTTRSAEMCPGSFLDSMEDVSMHPDDHGKLQLPEPGQPPGFDYDDWRKLVVQYSQCQLTKEDDKLVALSGLAKEYQTLLDDEYVCGLWRKTLHKDLSWHSDGGRQSNEENSFRPKHYRAPSWSWASFEGIIVYPYFISSIEDPLCTITDVSVTPCSEDRTGLISAASIEIIGSLRRLKVDVFENPWDDGLHGIYMDLEETREEADMDLFVLPVFSQGRPDNKEFLGLIVQPVREGGCQFTRVGLFHQGAGHGTVPGMEWNHDQQKWESEIKSDTESSVVTICLI